MPVASPTGSATTSDLALLLDAGREASALAMRYFAGGAKQWLKENGTPVSEADIAVSRLLADRLRLARPDYGWLCEEDEDDAGRLAASAVFIIDPIDGTREFLAGRQEWTISVAVVRAGRPTAALLAAPALGETYWAAIGEGTFLDGRRMLASAAADFGGARLAGPKRALREVAARAGVPPGDIRFVGSLAYRLAMVSLDRAEVAVGASGSREWDLAAADLLLQESGAALTDIAGDPIRYNRPDTIQPPVIAAAPALATEARRLVEGALANETG
ncbi:MAG: 3'(2'),5'-bisphosphate nucleotidase CysQ [Bauldia sp.]